ncbi:uncharacterized protein LOC115222845 isoform X1 [Argonauta hians]
MDAIPEFPKIVGEKKRVYENEEKSNPQQQSTGDGGGGGGGMKPSSSSSSICQYSTWKQKRKQTRSEDGGSGVPPGHTKSPPPQNHSKFSSHSFDGSLPSSGMASPLPNSDDGRVVGEKLVDDGCIIPVHDNPFFVKDGRRSIERKEMNGSLDLHNDENINSRQDLANFRDDTDMEYHPGSGFVSRLKDKFSSLSAREEASVLRPKRSSSVENLLDGRPNLHGVDLGLTDTRRKFLDGRAVSVENLNHTMDKSSTSPNLALDLKLAKQGSADGGGDLRNSLKDVTVTALSPTNHTGSPSPGYDAKPHIIVMSAAANDESKLEDELPKPNTVSSFRSLFENPANKVVAPVVAPVKASHSSPDTLVSSKKDLNKVALNLVKPLPSPKDKNIEGFGVKPEAARRTVFEARNSGSSVENNTNSLEQDATTTTTSTNTTTTTTSTTSTTKVIKLTTPTSPTPEPSPTPTSQTNQVPKAKTVADSEDDVNTESAVTDTTTNAELFNNRGLPSILMRKPADKDSGECGQVVLRKVKPRVLEEDDDLKGRITYYPAGLNKPSNNSMSSEEGPVPTPKLRHPPLVTDIRGFAPTDLWGEDDDDDDDNDDDGDNNEAVSIDGEVVEKDVSEHRGPIFITDAMLRKNPNADSLTQLDLSQVCASYNNDGGSWHGEYQEGYIPTKIGPCKIKFIGDGIKLDRSCITKSKTVKHKVCFSDEISTLHDYPSEEVMLEQYLTEHPDERTEILLDGFGGLNESTDDGSESDDSSPQSPEETMRSNTALSSSGGLALYHSKYGMEFEFGMEVEAELEARKSHDTKVNNGEGGDTFQLTPAEEQDLASWSNFSGTDLLF